MIFIVLNPAKIDINSLYICPPYLYTVATLPWEIPKSHFQRYYSYIGLLQIIYVISEKNKPLPPYPPHLKNVTTLPCKMQNFYIWLQIMLHSSNSEKSQLWVGIGGFENDWLKR